MDFIGSPCACGGVLQVLLRSVGFFRTHHRKSKCLHRPCPLHPLPHYMSKPSQSDLFSANLHRLITLPFGNLMVQSDSSLVSSVSLIITITNKDTVWPPTYSTPHHCVTALIHVFFMYLISIYLTYFSATPHFFIQLHSSCLSTPACTPDLQTYDAALSSSVLLRPSPQCKFCIYRYTIFLLCETRV